MRKKLFLAGVTVTLLSGCVPQYQYKKFDNVTYPIVINERRVPINAEGDFSGKPLTGAQFNRILSKKIEDGSWKGYVVHSLTAGPWNNTWSVRGLTVPSNIVYAGTYKRDNFFEGNGNDGGVSSRDMAGWYGFHVNMAETTKHGHYTGVNAFGVSAKVEQLNTSGAEIVFGSTQINDGSPEAVWADIDVIGAVPEDVNLNDLKIEYLARITGLQRTVIDRNTPTLSNPSYTAHRTQIVTGDLLAARLINAKTGKVYPVKLEWVFRTRNAFK